MTNDLPITPRSKPFKMSNFFELPVQYQLEWWQWAMAFFAAFVVGISKSGIKGISVITVTLLAILFGGKASTGIILLMFCVGDIFAVIYYNRYTQWKFLYKLLPWMFIGVIIGNYVGKDLPEQTFKRGMAIIILGVVLMMFWWDRNKDRIKVPDNWWFAGIMGLIAGFTTMIGNLAGPFANIFFLAMRLPKNEFIGTAAWLFLLLNLFKLPFHIFSWKTITLDTFLLDLRLLPFVFLGLVAGVAMVKVIKEQQYRQMILILTAIGAFLIFLR